MRRIAGLLVIAAAPALADAADMEAGRTLEAARTIRPGEVIAPADIRLVSPSIPGAISAPGEAVGKAARRLLTEGRPLMAGDLGPPTLVRRNSVVPLVYVRSGLTIRTEGRALGDGSEGERVRVMNLASRQTVTGTIAPDGSVEAGASQ
jgi:flagella basal body P-ring formation protein FlgA